MSALIDPDEEYECQHYGYSSTAVLNGIKDILEDVFKSLLDSMGRKLVSNYNYDTDEVAGIKEKLLNEYRESIERHSEDLREVIKMYFSIPKRVILPEDEDQRVQYSKEDEERRDALVKASVDRFKALAAFEKRLKEILQAISRFSDLKEKMSNANVKCTLLLHRIEEAQKSPPLVDLSEPIMTLMDGFSHQLGDLKLE